jgi:hypothetical protein
VSAVEIILPVLSAIVGYVLRHINVFGHPAGGSAAAPALPPHTVVAPLPQGGVDLRALLTHELGVVLRSVLQSLEGGGGAGTPPPKQ